MIEEDLLKLHMSPPFLWVCVCGWCFRVLRVFVSGSWWRRWQDWLTGSVLDFNICYNDNWVLRISFWFWVVYKIGETAVTVSNLSSSHKLYPNLSYVPLTISKFSFCCSRRVDGWIISIWPLVGKKKKLTSTKYKKDIIIIL